MYVRMFTMIRLHIIVNNVLKDVQLVMEQLIYVYLVQAHELKSPFANVQKDILKTQMLNAKHVIQRV